MASLAKSATMMIVPFVRSMCGRHAAKSSVVKQTQRCHHSALSLTTNKRNPTAESSPDIVPQAYNRLPTVKFQTVGVSSVCGLRSSNEDRTLVHRLASDLLLVGVFDGHGGCEASDFVSGRLPELVTYWLDRTDWNYQLALHNSFTDVNKRLKDMLLHKQKMTSSAPCTAVYDRDMNKKILSCGTTATVCLLRGNSDLFIAHVGDSRAMLCSRSGLNQVLTKDHHPDDSRELKRILENSGHVTQSNAGRPRVNGILEITRSIGDFRLKEYGVTAEPEIVTVELDSSNDTILMLCTDGVHNTIHTDAMAEAVSSSVDVVEAATCVVEEALFCGSNDNCTALVLPLMTWDNIGVSRDNLSPCVIKFAPSYMLGRRA